MKKTIFTITFGVATLCLLGACGKNSGKKVANALTTSTTTAKAESPCLPFEDPSVNFVNSFFIVDTLDLVERSLDETGSLPTQREVNLGGTLGTATIAITEEMKLIFHQGGQTYELNPDQEAELSSASIKALDLDGDGLKEILVHTGDLFDLYVYGLESGSPELKGSMTMNNGFFITDDRTIVARLGTQGLCTLAHYDHGTLTVSEEESISRLMFMSKEYANLRYDFDECSADTIAPLLDVEHYAVCHQDMAVLHADLDGDGTDEQIVYAYASWGATQVDAISVIHHNDELDLFYPILETQETLGIEDDGEGYFVHVNDPIQLSAVDCDGDSLPEVVVTIGRQHANASFIFKLDKQGDVTMLKHFRLDRKPTVKDMSILG